MERKTTVDPDEVEQFSRMAQEWWDPRGKFKPLHQINPVRVGWILKQVNSAWWRVNGEKKEHQPLQGKALLDIGCGGGLVCEPMARLGARVTGIDAAEKNIAVAGLHAEQSGLEIDYRCMTAEELVASEKSSSLLTTHHSPLATSFDIVLALEIVEHVADVPLFVESCAKLVKPGGLLIMSTLNRTIKSYALAIVGAEYVLRMLPRGTHQWEKFLKPHELATQLRANDIEIVEMTGMAMNPLSWKWELTQDLGVNYVVAGRKPVS